MLRRIAIVLFCLLSGAAAFAPSPNTQNGLSSTRGFSVQQQQSTTALSERRWNFNEGQSPWGLKKNAEIWNGRVAQMAFTFVFLQELIQGKGVISGIQEGDPINIAAAGAFFITLLGFTGFLALKGDDDYVNQS